MSEATPTRPEGIPDGYECINATVKADEDQTWELWGGGDGSVVLPRKDGAPKGSLGILTPKETKKIDLQKGEVAHFINIWAKKL